jgi:hypothetical protein
MRLENVCSFKNVILEHVPCMRHKKCIQNFGRKRDHLEDLSIDRRIIYKWILWSKFIWFRISISGRLLRTHNEPSGSIKWWEFIDKPSDY